MQQSVYWETAACKNIFLQSGHKIKFFFFGFVINIIEENARIALYFGKYDKVRENGVKWGTKERSLF